MNPLCRPSSRALALMAAAVCVGATAPAQAAQVPWAFSGRLTGHDAWPGVAAEAAAGKPVTLVAPFENEALLKQALLLADGGHRHPGSLGGEDILSLFGSPLQVQAAPFEQNFDSVWTDWRTELVLRSTALASWAYTTDKRKPQR